MKSINQRRIELSQPDLLPGNWTVQNEDFLIISPAGRGEKSNAKFSEQQIALTLKQVDEGIGVEEFCRKAGVSLQTY